jgi:hypothetical protein
MTTKPNNKMPASFWLGVILLAPMMIWFVICVPFAFIAALASMAWNGDSRA